MQDRATRALLDPVTVPKPGHLRLRDAQGLTNQAHTVPRLLAVVGALAESLLGQHWGHQVRNSVGIAADAGVLRGVCKKECIALSSGFFCQLT